MSMEPLPLGSFGDFSITVDAPLASLWPTPPLMDDHPAGSSHQGVEEVRPSLDAAAPAPEPEPEPEVEMDQGLDDATVVELEAIKSQVRTKQHDIAALTDLIRRATEERDLLRRHNTLLHAHKLQAVPSSCNDDEAGPSTPSPVPLDASAMFMPFAAGSSSPADAVVEPTSAAAVAALHQMPSPAALVATEAAASPSFAAMDGEDMRAAAAALQVPSFAAMDDDDMHMHAAAAALHMPSHADVVACCEDSSVAAAALEVPSFAPVTGEDTSAAAAAAAQVEQLAASLDGGSGHRPLPSSPFPFPVPFDRPAMLMPFAMPSPAAAVAVDRSTAEVPGSATAVAVENRSKLAAAVARLDVLAGKRPLPHKGQLLQAVVDAGPLLQNLMVAGTMPRWRNPPPALTNTMLSAPPSGSSAAQMGSPWPTHSPSGSAGAPMGLPWPTPSPSGSAAAQMGSPWPTHAPSGSSAAPMGSPWPTHSPSGSAGAPMGSPWPTYSPSGSGAPMAMG